MLMKLIFYTVLLDQAGFPVKYVDRVTYRIKRLTGPFQDPGEASQEFKARIGSHASCYLEPRQFRAKAVALAKLRRARAKNTGTIRV
jgi:hypothetical protein